MCSSSTETRSIVKHRSTLRKLASLLKLLNLLSNPDSYRTNAQIHVASHPLLRLSHSRLSHPVPWLVLSHTFEDFPLGSRSLCASERNPSLFLLSCGSFQPLVQRFNKDSSTDQTIFLVKTLNLNIVADMSSENEAPSSSRSRRLSCTKAFDALWFCYTPVHQLQQYYRLGVLDNCSEKWNAVLDCLSLKTKRSTEMQVYFLQLCASERNPSLFLLSCGSFQPLVQRFNKDSSTDQTIFLVKTLNLNIVADMSSENEAPSSSRSRRLSCTKAFDALWFCYTPVHQLQQYYRLGVLDNCSEKWNAVLDCLSLKTKRSTEMQVTYNCNGSVLNQMFAYVSTEHPLGAAHGLEKEILETREKAKPHIWTFRTPEEASSHWKELFGHLDDPE
ncbi:hypothetical protein CJ030_MR1G000263 [Morella rubra]|uniref:Uncharacterized protein n=1 Tax=Morella rubra TaxID=262757 RepID=A0A6A1WUB6_9ROSI|nr:hypothetical protein CJ030_MR1G000263 [Morella rubra]